MNTQHYKDLLQNEKGKLVQELSAIGHINPDNPKDWQPDAVKIDLERSDRIDTADNSEEFQENTAIVNELEVRLGAIDAALERIDTNTYGVCEKCNSPIEADRLEANPAATTCKNDMK